jgi:hypothetical protein
MFWTWLRSILDQIISHLPPKLQQLWHLLADFKDKALSLFDRINTLIHDVEHEVTAIRNFEVDIKWKTRVISAPQAIQTMQDFFQSFPDIIDQVKAIVSEIKDKINVPETTFNPEEVEGLDSLRKLPGKLAKIGEKLAGWATLILDALVTVSNFVDQLQSIVNDIRRIRETIETADAIFLPQGRPKRVFTGTYRKRQS